MALQEQHPRVDGNYMSVGRRPGRGRARVVVGAENEVIARAAPSSLPVNPEQSTTINIKLSIGDLYRNRINIE